MSTRPSIIKNKRRKTAEENNLELDNLFSNLDLKTFCPKKVFDVIFIAEGDDVSTETLNELVKTAREYEEISCLTFITREEVLKLLDDFDPSVFPPAFQSLLQEFHVEIRRKATLKSSSPVWQALLLKLKLMEVMSVHYLKELGKMEKRNILEVELESLAHDSRKSPKKKIESKAKADKKKSNVSITNLGEKKSKGRLDTKASLAADIVGYRLMRSNSDIVFDDDIFNHVWFYVFQGFLDAEVLKQLHSVNVEIRALIKFDRVTASNGLIGSPSAHQIFWNKIQDYTDGPHRITNFADTILMKFSASGTNSKELFEELLYVIKNTSDIKLKHLDYIRHLTIYHQEERHKFLPLECLHNYNSASEQVPLELTSATTVLIDLLKETSVRLKCFDEIEEEDLWKTISSQSVSITHNGRCKNPCDFWETTKHIKALKPLEKPRRTFMVHESDMLSIVSKTFRGCGSALADNVNKLLRLLKPFDVFENTAIATENLLHKHDLDPAKKLDKNLTKSQQHFLYLLLFSTFKHDQTIEVFEDTELTENLQTYDKPLFYRSSRPEVEADQSDCEESLQNLYDTSPMAFTWKEELHSLVMTQEIWNNRLSFQYMDTKFSPKTDNLLVQFSDHLDGFGINTKTYDVTVRTPVCLRDFCRYVTVDESEWLEANKPVEYVRKSEEVEVCKGAKKIKKLDLFQEYRYLLNPEAEPDEDAEATRIDEEEDAVTFDQMMAVIQNYPPSTKLTEECGKVHDKAFLVYDFGTDYFAVKGAETVFASHDNVKIRVDNTRMLYEEPKCTVTLSSEGNTLILHSNKSFLGKAYTFNWTLEDGTIISFSLQEQQKAKRKSVTPRDEDQLEEPVEDETFLLNAMNRKVINLSKADFEHELGTADFDTLVDDPSDEDGANIYKYLQQAIQEECPVYKINNNLTLLTKRADRIEIPLRQIIRRLLHNMKREPMAPYTKRYVSTTEKSASAVDKLLDFRVCLPNGLYITCYRSQVRDNLVEVKQEFVSDEVRIEEFRLFTRDGYVLIKKIDGTITLLKSNGDIITFEKPDSQNVIIRGSNLKPCHCKNLNDYRKKLNKLMKEEFSKEKFYISRRDLFKTKKGYIISEDIAAVLDSNNVPYLKTALLNFDGVRTTLESKKITQKRVYHTTSEQDFLAEELYFERDDGFQSMFDKNGSQIVKFADGTKITSCIRVSKELVDGYVFVSLDFTYEHVDYVTVTYDSEDNLGLHLKNVVVERNNKDDIKLEIGNEIVTKVNSETVTFNKVCKECDSAYTCSFRISPFLSKNFDYSAQFLHAQDSYDKHFHVDFEGKSKRNKCYVQGPLNRSGCDHYRNRVYKKLFVVDRTFAGEQFWSSQMIEMKKKSAENKDDIDVIEKTDITNDGLSIVDFRKQLFVSLAARFINSRILEEQICLSKYRQSQEKKSLYTTTRVFREMMDFEKITTFLTNLSSWFTEQNKTNGMEEFIRNIIQENVEHLTDLVTFSNLKKKQVEVEPDDAMKECKCVQKRKSFKDKISRWQSECEKFRGMIREKKIPLYFNSQFCEVID